MKARAGADLSPGSRFGRYRIEAHVASGGMGVVYRATDAELGRRVALKLIGPQLASDEGFRERFKQESRVAAALDHPHVIPVYEAGERDGALYIAMRFVDGIDLKAVIRERGGLEPRLAARITSRVASALDASHAAGLVHRDVKPANVLLAGGPGEEHPYLTDFGLAKQLHTDAAVTGSGQWLGTLDYVAPEQVLGEAVDARADVYALACLLFEALTGEVPYPRETEPAKLIAKLQEPPPSLSERAPGLPRELEAVIRRGMARAPGERYPSAGDLGRVALAAAEGRPPTAPERTVAAGPAAPPSSPAASTAPARQPADELERRAKGWPARGREPTEAAEPRPTTAADGRPQDRAPSTAVPFGQPAERVREQARRKPALLAASALIFVLLAGFLTARLTAGEQPSFANSASTDSLGLSFPDPWRRINRAPSIPGIDFKDRLALAPDAPGVQLVAGRVATTGPALLPRPFLKRLGERPRPDAVRLGELAAYRYRGLRPGRSRRRVTLFVVPTTKGVATVACVGDRPGDELGGCERIAQTLELSGAKPYPLGPDGRYAAALNKAIATLNSARERGLRELRRAATPNGQARAADGVARAYRSAAKNLSEVSISPVARPANAAIIAALSRAERGYARLAADARGGNHRAYEAAREDVGRGEAAVQRALKGLKRLGYRVG